MAREFSQDFSSFMCVILMLIGVLMILLISNVLTIISNPENVQISALIKNALYDENPTDDMAMIVPKFANKAKEPVYVDVYRDSIVIYPEEIVVKSGEITQPGNAFEQLLGRVSELRDRKYIVLLARPHSARMVRRLRETIKDRKIDIGFELYEANRPVKIEGARSES